jgi:hypothetical protein
VTTKPLDSSAFRILSQYTEGSDTFMKTFERQPRLTETTSVPIIAEVEAWSATETSLATTSMMQPSPGLPDPAASRSGASTDTGTGNIGSTPEQSAIHDQVESIIAAIGCNPIMNARLREAWMMFGVFLQGRGTLPERLQDIAATEFEPFVSHCRATQANVDGVLWALSPLLTILAHAGHRADALAALTVRTTSVRVGSGGNRKYRRERRFATPATGSGAATGRCDLPEPVR